MPVDPEADRRIVARLRSAGVAPAIELIVLHVSASNPFRRWPEPAFAEVVASLVSQSPDRRMILSSGPSDRLAADRIVAAARATSSRRGALQVIDFGEFDLAELRALVERSGPVHRRRHRTASHRRDDGHADRRDLRTDAARSLDAVAQPVHRRASRSEIADLPCRPCDQRVCAPGDYRCLTTIKPADVVVAAERMLR